MLEVLRDAGSDAASSVSLWSATGGARGETCGSANKSKHFFHNPTYQEHQKAAVVLYPTQQPSTTPPFAPPQPPRALLTVADDPPQQAPRRVIIHIGEGGGLLPQQGPSGGGGGDVPPGAGPALRAHSGDTSEPCHDPHTPPLPRHRLTRGRSPRLRLTLRLASRRALMLSITAGNGHR